MPFRPPPPPPQVGFKGSFKVSVQECSDTVYSINAFVLEAGKEYTFTDTERRVFISGSRGSFTVSAVGGEEGLEIAEREDCCGCEFDDDWDRVRGECRGKKRIAIVGGKNVGKTTMLRMVANSILSDERNRGEVWVLDGDTGRPVRGFRRCVSLTRWRGEGGGEEDVREIEEGGKAGETKSTARAMERAKARKMASRREGYAFICIPSSLFPFISPIPST